VSPCGTLEIDTVLSDVTFLNNVSARAEELGANFCNQTSPSELINSCPQSSQCENTTQSIVGLVEVYHKRRGTGGILERIVNDDAIRVTAKGKLLHLTIKIDIPKSDAKSDSVTNDRQQSLTQTAWNWTTDFRLRLFSSQLNTFYNDGFSITSKNIEHSPTLIMIHLEVRLWKVSKGLQFSCDVRLPSGEILQQLTSVKFSTYSHGRGCGKMNEKSRAKETSPHSFTSTLPESLSDSFSMPLASANTIVTNKLNCPPQTNSQSVTNTNNQIDSATFESTSDCNMSGTMNVTPKKRKVVTTNEKQNEIIVPGNLVVNGSVRATEFIRYSDIRLKTNIQELTEALNIVTNLSGKRYEWREGTLEGLRGGERAIGFIAQEVQRILPEAVKVTENGYLSIEYDQLIPVIIEALKEHLRQYQENKIATQNDIRNLQSQLRDKEATTKELTAELQEVKLKLERLRLESNLPPHILRKRNSIVAHVTNRFSHEINNQGIKFFIVLDWKYTLPEPFFELQSTCKVETKKIYHTNSNSAPRRFVGYAIRCLNDDAKYIGRYRVTVGYPNAKTLCMMKNDVQLTLLDLRTNDWMKANQPGPEHIIHHPTQKYVVMVYFVVTPTMSSFITNSTLATEIRQQQRQQQQPQSQQQQKKQQKYEKREGVSSMFVQSSALPPANPSFQLNTKDIQNMSVPEESDDDDDIDLISLPCDEIRNTYQSFSQSQSPTPVQQFRSASHSQYCTQTCCQSQNQQPHLPYYQYFVQRRPLCIHSLHSSVQTQDCSRPQQQVQSQLHAKPQVLPTQPPYGLPFVSNQNFLVFQSPSVPANSLSTNLNFTTAPKPVWPLNNSNMTTNSQSSCF
jgi:hypothetical protein